MALGAARLRCRWKVLMSGMRSLRLKRLRKSRWCNNCLISPWILFNGRGTRLCSWHMHTYFSYKCIARSAPLASATMLSAHFGITRASQSSRARPLLSNCNRAAPAPPTWLVRCADPSNWTMICGSPPVAGTSTSPLTSSRQAVTHIWYSPQEHLVSRSWTLLSILVPVRSSAAAEPQLVHSDSQEDAVQGGQLQG